MDKNYSLKNEDEMQDDDDFVAEEKRPLIPEGTYQVSCFRIEKGISHFKSLKMYLWFRIVDPGAYYGIELFMPINLLDTKTGKPFKKVPKGSKYYEQWVIANRNIPPSRNDRMSSKIFMNGVFEAVVSTVKQKFPDGTEKPDCFDYSKVDYLKKRLE